MVDLGRSEVAAALTCLTALTALYLPTVFVAEPSLLSPLLPLTALTALGLGFGSEWWLRPGDLAVLRCLPRLTHLALSIDYGMPDGDGDDLEAELREEAQMHDDWRKLFPALPCLTHCQLSLAHGMGSHLLPALGMARPCLQAVVLEARNVSLARLQLGPPSANLTELSLGGSEGGVALTPTDCWALAGLSGLRRLALECTLLPGL
ncbi:uncharacterized protein HaLaN_20239, partial [Haematococcus lacustris]